MTHTCVIGFLGEANDAGMTHVCVIGRGRTERRINDDARMSIHASLGVSGATRRGNYASAQAKISAWRGDDQAVRDSRRCVRRFSEPLYIDIPRVADRRINGRVVPYPLLHTQQTVVAGFSVCYSSYGKRRPMAVE